MLAVSFRLGVRAMKILVGDVEVAASSVGSILGHVAERADLCIKVLDRDGYVRAVNERGLALLQVPQDQFCGQIWADLWTEEYHAKAANAVELGLQGVTSSFTGRFRTGDGVMRTWVVEVMPLDRIGSDITKLLVISSDVTTVPHAGTQSEVEAEAIAALMDNCMRTLHKLRNVVSTTNGAARIMQRGASVERLEELAKLMQDSALQCNEVIASMESALGLCEQLGLDQSGQANAPDQTEGFGVQ